MSRATRDRVWDAVPLHPQHADDGSDREGHPLDLSHLDAATEGQVIARLVSRDFDAWSEAASRVGHCARPIRLHGSSRTVDAVTGEVFSSFSSADSPLGVLHVRCGNRRAADCPSCSRVYAADTFHLIRAGVVGGKGIPVAVSENPLVFATLTAPSFGPVHGTRNGRRCRPYRTEDEADRCVHGRLTSCRAVHVDGDAMLGQPLCGDCYDYESHLVWQWWPPELWRRFTIALRRVLARMLGISPHRLAQVATVQFAKVAEYQLRGLVHFHALIRVDGKATDTDSHAAVPVGITAALLSSAIETAAASVWFDAPPLFGGDLVRRLRFGSQVDVRPVRDAHRTDDPEKQLEAEQVAGYLAKYATKSGPTRPTRPARTCTGSARPSPRPSPGSSSRRPRPTSPWPSTRTRCSASGRTCSGSAATSPPSHAATASPSAGCAAPASGSSAASRPPTAKAAPSRPASSTTSSKTTTPKPPSLSATGPTPDPAGTPTATPNSPKPLPLAPASTHRNEQPSAKTSPTERGRLK